MYVCPWPLAPSPLADGEPLFVRYYCRHVLMTRMARRSRSRSTTRRGANVVPRLLKVLWSDESLAVGDRERLSFASTPGDLTTNVDVASGPQASLRAVVTVVGSNADGHDASPIAAPPRSVSFASVLGDLTAKADVASGPGASLRAVVTVAGSDADGHNAFPIAASSQSLSFASVLGDLTANVDVASGPQVEFSPHVDELDSKDVDYQSSGRPESLLDSFDSSPTPTSQTSPRVECSSRLDENDSEVDFGDVDYRSPGPPEALMDSSPTPASQASPRVECFSRLDENDSEVYFDDVDYRSPGPPESLMDSSPTTASQASPRVECFSRLDENDSEVDFDDVDYRSLGPPESLVDIWERGPPSSDVRVPAVCPSSSLHGSPIDGPVLRIPSGHSDLHYHGPSTSTSSVNLTAALQYLREKVDANKLPIFCEYAVIDDDDENVERLMLQILSQADIFSFYVGVTTDPVRRWLGGRGPTSRAWMHGHRQKYGRMDILAIRGPGFAASLEKFLITSARNYYSSVCANKALDSRGCVRCEINYLYLVSI